MHLETITTLQQMYYQACVALAEYQLSISTELTACLKRAYESTLFIGI